MTLETTTNSAIEALAKNQLIHWAAGDAWESGCEVTLGDSTEDIVVNIAGGSVYVGGTDNPVTVNAQSKILQPGDATNPRKDVIVVDAEGSVDAIAGTPAPIKSDLNPSNPGFDPVYHAYRPAPEELDGRGGELLALGVVWVPPDATSSSDLDDDITYVQDRRLGAPIGSGGIGGAGGANVITTKQITHEGGVTSTVATFNNVSEDRSAVIFPQLRITENSSVPDGDWNTEHSVGWNGTGWDLSITITWDDDPGAGNDLYLDCLICNGAPKVVTTDFDAADAVAAINDDTDHGSTASHDYFSANPSDLNQEGATDNQHIAWDAGTGQYTPQDPPSGGGSVGASDDGVQVLADASDFNFGADLSVTDDTDGTVTVDSTAAAGSTDGVDITPGTVQKKDRSVVYAYGPNGNYQQPYKVADYADLGAAVNAAFADLATVGYGVVVMPPTDETFSTTIHLTEDYISLQGSGMWATRPQYTGSDCAFRLDGADRGNHGNFGLRGDGTSGQDLLELTALNEQISHYSYQNVYLENAGRHAIHEICDGPNNRDIYDGLYHTIYINGTGDHAIYSPQASGAGNASRTFFNVQAMTSPIQGDLIHDMSGGIHKRYISIESEPVVNGVGFRVQNGYCPIFLGCRAEGQGSHGFQLNNTRSALLQNCISWNSGGHGIYLSGDNREAQIKGYFATGTPSGYDDMRILSTEGNTTVSLGTYTNTATKNIDAGVDVLMDVQAKQFGTLDGS